MTRLSKWVKKNLKGNVKETLDATIKHLITLKPPLNGKGDKAESMKSSLRGLMKNEEMREEFKELDRWFIAEKKSRREEFLERIRGFNQKIQVLQDKKPLETKTQNSIKTTKEQVASAKDRGTDEKLVHNLQKPESKQDVKKDDKTLVHPPIPQKITLSSLLQGKYAKSTLGYVKNALFKFIISHREHVSSKAMQEFAAKHRSQQKTDFSEALSFINFITEHISFYMTHHSGKILFRGEYGSKPLVILNSFKAEFEKHEGSWCDEKLRRLVTLALSLVNCLGDDFAFGKLQDVKKKLCSQIKNQRALSAKRKREDYNEKFPKKMKYMKDKELGELMDFTQDMVNKLESENDEHINRIARLAIDKDEAFVTIWKSLATRKDENAKIQKFIFFMNAKFDMGLKKKKNV